MTRKFLFLLAMSLAALTAGLAQQPAGAQASPNGEALFRQRCSSCHAVVPGRPATLGPSLIGVVGRKAAATPFRYSPALKASGITWTRGNIDRYLTGPARMVPGTRMVIAVSDGGQRAALITYLEAKK